MVQSLLAASKNSSTILMVVLIAVMVVVLIVLPMFTNKRRNKAINDLHSSLRPGDVIKTVGGIVGTIVEIKEISPVDKEMVIETGVGDNKSTMVFDIQAVYQVISKVTTPIEPSPVASPVEEQVSPVSDAQEAPAEAAEETSVAETPAEETSAADAPAEEVSETPVEEAPKAVKTPRGKKSK